MKISGFTFVRNAEKFYFPIKESIESILPIVDEMVVALGDSDDRTEEWIRSIQSPKIKIIHRVWDPEQYKDGSIYRIETNAALDACIGDWCFYIQGDEVVHEEDLPIIQQACKKYLSQIEVDGLLFQYLHFWGDYDHYLPFHGWYPKEIRVIRNHKQIRSYKDAQSFRYASGEKLKVKEIAARIFHYGWVRPPEIMQAKKKDQDSMYWGKKRAEEHYKDAQNYFNFGDLSKIPLFKGTHPHVMNDFRKKMYWHKHLVFDPNKPLFRGKLKHEQLKYRLLTWIEKNILGGKSIGGYSNWIMISR